MHLVDSSPSYAEGGRAVARLREMMAEQAARAKQPLPRVAVYHINAMELPGELKEKVDLVFHTGVFDDRYFTPSQLRQVAREITRVVKTGGMHISAFYHLDGYFDSKMRRVGWPDIIFEYRHKGEDDGKQGPRVLGAEAGRELVASGALTRARTYALGRKFFSFFGWNPKDSAGLRKRDRAVEIVFAPVYFADIVLHTFALSRGRGGLNRYRAGGAAAVWGASFAAAAGAAVLTAGAPAWIAGAALLANALSHSAYNIFFGIGTPADSPLAQDVLTAVSILKRALQQQYLPNRNLHPVNREILEQVLDRLERAGDNADAAALEKDYNECLSAVVNVLHSQAWLSPTYPSSRIRERGILQGDKYSSTYEREELKPELPEQYLVAFSEEGSASYGKYQRSARLYRNVGSLLGDLSAAFLETYGPEEIFVSNRLPAPVRRKLKSFLPGAKAAERKQHRIFFVGEKDVSSGALQKIVHGDPAEKLIVVYATKKVDLPLELLKPGLPIFVVYSLEGRPDGATSPIAFVTNYTPYTPSGIETQVFNHLSDLRKRGGNIDSYTAWYLSLYYDQTDPEHLDESSYPYYYDVLGGELLLEKAGELEQRYDDLRALLDGIPAPEGLLRQIRGILASTARRHRDLARAVRERGPPEDFDLAAHRAVFAEYRTLLRHATYLAWVTAVREGRAPALYASLERKLEQRFNDLVVRPRGRDGELHRSSLLFASGMATIKTVLAFLVREEEGSGAPLKAVVGNSVYYEIENLVQKDIAKQPLEVTRLSEKDTAAITRAVAGGEYRALVLDPVSNSMRSPEKTKDSRGGFNRNGEDLPVADLKAILARLLERKYEKPFYFIIDTSLFGPTFQLADFLDGADIPDNLHFVLYSSLQKLYQDGLELTSGGVLTLVSKDEAAHRRIIERLRENRSFIGTDPTLLGYLSLDTLAPGKEEFAGRTRKIMENAQSLAEHMYAEIKRRGAGDRVFHPALPSHPGHAVWQKNRRPGVPFVLLRTEKPADSLRLVRLLSKKLLAAGLPLLGRDSYGFSSLTYTFYYHNTDQMTLRISLPPYSSREMAVLEKIFSEAYAEFCKEPAGERTEALVSGLTLKSSYALGRKLLSLFGWTPQDEAGRKKQDSFIEKFLAPFVFVWDLPVHTLLLLFGKDGLSSEKVEALLVGNLRLELPQVWVARLGALTAWGATLLALHFIPAWTAGALAPWLAAYLANALAHSSYNFRHGSGTSAAAPLTLDDKGRVRELVGRVADPSERRRLERVLELDRDEDETVIGHLFVEDRKGRADRLDVLDVSKMTPAERKKLSVKLEQWFEYAGPEKVHLNAAVRGLIMLLGEDDAKRAPDRASGIALAVSRDADNNVREIEAMTIYNMLSRGFVAQFTEIAPWNRGGNRRYKGVASQLLYWIFTHAGTRRVSFATPFKDMQDLFDRYAPDGNPWKPGHELKEEVLDAFIADQKQRAAAAQQKQWALALPLAAADTGDLSRAWAQRFVPGADWAFDPGMLFDGQNEWWGNRKARKGLHGGVDFYSFRDAAGNERQVEAGTALTPLADGVVVNVVDDFVGRTVIMRHGLADGQGRTLYTFYAHVEPAESVQPGKRFSTNDTIARVAAPRKSGAPAHLHLAMAFSGQAGAFGAFRWETANPSQFVDPFGETPVSAGRPATGQAAPQAAGPEARIALFDEIERADIEAVVNEVKEADIVVGIPCYDEKDNLPSLIAQIQEGLSVRGKRTVIVVIGERVKPETLQAALTMDGARGVRVVGFTKDPQFAGREGKKWSERAFFTIANELQPEIFVSLDADLRLDPSWVKTLAAPALEGKADFVTPNYIRHYTGDDKSLTHHIVSPLFSALYGWAISEPVGGEFAVRVKGSALLAAYLDTPGIWTAPNPYEAFFLAGAITRSAKVEEVWLGTKEHKLMNKGNFPELFSGVYARSLFEQVLRDWEYVVSKSADRTIRAPGKHTAGMAGSAADILDINYDEWIAGYRAGFEKHREFYRENFPYLYDHLQTLYNATDAREYDLTSAEWTALVLIFLKQYKAADQEKRNLLLDALAPLFMARVITFSAQMRGATYGAMEEELQRQAAGFAALK
ncbi:MAG: hypothetical protein ACYC5N_00125, partial [Endomicrobiales bacterium]